VRGIQDLVVTEGLTLGEVMKTLATLAKDVSQLGKDVSELRGSVNRLSWMVPLIVTVGMVVVGVIVALKK
jgi:hypothetical protein